MTTSTRLALAKAMALEVKLFLFRKFSPLKKQSFLPPLIPTTTCTVFYPPQAVDSSTSLEPEVRALKALAQVPGGGSPTRGKGSPRAKVRALQAVQVQQQHSLLAQEGRQPTVVPCPAPPAPTVGMGSQAGVMQATSPLDAPAPQLLLGWGGLKMSPAPLNSTQGGYTAHPARQCSQLSQNILVERILETEKRWGDTHLQHRLQQSLSWWKRWAKPHIVDLIKEGIKPQWSSPPRMSLSGRQGPNLEQAKEILLDYQKSGAVKEVQDQNSKHLLPWFLISKPEEGGEPSGGSFRTAEKSTSFFRSNPSSWITPSKFFQPSKRATGPPKSTSRTLFFICQSTPP